jgi:hypothetical protein
MFSLPVARLKFSALAFFLQGSVELNISWKLKNMPSFVIIALIITIDIITGIAYHCCNISYYNNL